MTGSNATRIAGSADFAAVFGVSRETIERLVIYEKLLRRWQKTINLVAPSTLDDVWHRHFGDSAQVISIVRQHTPSVAVTGGLPLHWVDLGSGAGFPGLVVGILLAEAQGGALTLIDSDQRKVAFLREVARETGLKARITVDIIAERIESRANHSKVPPATVVSARALAPLPKLLGWAQPLFGPMTIGVFLKGREAAVEVEVAKVLAGWDLAMEASLTDADAKIVVARRRI